MSRWSTTLIDAEQVHVAVELYLGAAGLTVAPLIRLGGEVIEFAPETLHQNRLSFGIESPTVGRRSAALGASLIREQGTVRFEALAVFESGPRVVRRDVPYASEVPAALAGALFNGPGVTRELAAFIARQPAPTDTARADRESARGAARTLLWLLDRDDCLEALDRPPRAPSHSEQDALPLAVGVSLCDGDNQAARGFQVTRAGGLEWFGGGEIELSAASDQALGLPWYFYFRGGESHLGIHMVGSDPFGLASATHPSLLSMPLLDSPGAAEHQSARVSAAIKASPTHSWAGQMSPAPR